MTTEQYIKMGRRTALVSFVLGTAIFGLYCLTSSLSFFLFSWDLIAGGFCFMIFVGWMNLSVILEVISRAIKDRHNRKKLITTIGLMLLNIPIMFLYCWATFLLLNTMRISFVNLTQSALTDINIIGCEAKHIDKLEAGENKLVWVSIKSDCSITVDYLLRGQREEETVVAYISPLLGHKITHIIGKKVDNTHTQHRL